MGASLCGGLRCGREGYCGEDGCVLWGSVWLLLSFWLRGAVFVVHGFTEFWGTFFLFSHLEASFYHCLCPREGDVFLSKSAKFPTNRNTGH